MLLDYGQSLKYSSKRAREMRHVLADGDKNQGYEASMGIPSQEAMVTFK